MRRSFYTLFLTNEKVDLVKDQGMIAYYLYRLGYDSHFVSFIEPSEDDCFQQQVEGLSLHFLGEQQLPRHPQLMMFCRKAFKFIFQHRKDIDILNLYYIKHSIWYGLFYKLLRPKGCLYVKVDMNVKAFLHEAEQWYHFVRRFIYKLYLHCIVDKVTVESTAGYRFLQQEYHLPHSKICYLPNGNDDNYLNQVEAIPFYQKRNIILTVGRIGTWEKNNELLLEACKKVEWRDDWELHLIGPVEENFKSYISNFYQETNLQDRVKFIGPIYDKCELFQYYNQSKVFCLTSRHESFGFVCIEAQAYGNYLISTPISTVNDFIPNDEIGKKVETAEELAMQINNLMNDDKLLVKAYPKILQHALQFRWSIITEKLDKFLQK